MQRHTLVSVTLALGVAACSTESANKGGDAEMMLPASCTQMGALQIVFAPMYSAYDGVHRFQVPAIVTGLAANQVTWTSSDETVATIATDATVGGAMVTVTGAGTATLIAEAGGLCGTSMIIVDSATSDEWQQGSDRYNNGIVYSRSHGDAGLPDGSSNMDPACTNCHGPTANGPYTDVAHTPEQIGGFSDDVLSAIMQMGVVPDGGYFDTSIISYGRWQRLHHWQFAPEDVKGVIVYLRSLTPMPQMGSSNFGGFGGDGGFGGPRPDMSQPGNPDGG